ncbi:MAG TPA: arginine--tRNA ligase [Candidatus Saccharimonadia bacterium]|nr:arginine--tRNA ligase [Candidatus Saccharimonadia bacterium]
MTRKQLENQIKKTVAAQLGTELDLSRLDVTVPGDSRFGDYATNAAMVFAAQLGRPPREVAAELAEALQAAIDDIETAEVAGPGFINVTLSGRAMTQAAQAALGYRPELYRGQKVVAEYSDPNPFKPLHAGHLYTTLVGDTVARLLELAGADVVRVTYGGDVGLHVARAMWAIIRFLNGENPEAMAKVPAGERPQWLGQRYVEGTSAYEDDEAARAEIILMNKRVYELHASGDRDSPFAQLYWMGRTWSYDYFPEFYAQLGVRAFDRTIPESEVTPLGIQTVREQLKAGVYEESDGAVVFRGEQYGLHTRVFINSQGLPTYEAKDVGLLLTKWQDYAFDRSIVITANEQEQYMAVMLKSVEQFAPEPARRSRHLTHGTVKLAGGVKMSSRKGNIVGAFDILEAATAAARSIVPASTHETVLAAVKYAFLKQRIGGDIIYDPKESVSLEGSSGPYLQYAHARARSILAKSPAVDARQLVDLDAAERPVAAKIAEYADVVQRAAEELMPHHVAGYLYELAQVFNRFYESSRVIGDARQPQRLVLVGLYADVLAAGLGLLGIAASERL